METHVRERMEGLINRVLEQEFIDVIDGITDDLVNEGFDELDIATYLTEIIKERLVG